MLLELEIKDFALIDQLNISFKEGLNILSGETGAGKSIIIDAVNMAIGERADRSFIRSGCDKASVQAIFHVKNIEDMNQVLEEYGVNDGEGYDTLIITRDIYANGRSTCRVNGVIVTQSVLKIITQKLIDIHGQHEHQYLLNPSFHMDMLDLYGGKDILDLVSNVSVLYHELQTVQEKLDSICFDEAEKQKRIDLIKFQLDEIGGANLFPEEEEELKKQKKILSNSEKIYQSLSNIHEILYGENSESSVLDRIYSTVNAMSNILPLDEKFMYFNNVLEETQYKLEDISREMRTYIDHIDFDSKILEEVENRLDLINTLKRKYGNTIEEILLYQQKIELELRDFEKNDVAICNLKQEIDVKYNELKKQSLKLSLLRKSIAIDFEQKLTDILQTLNMGKVQFKVSFTNEKEIQTDLKFTSKGIDQLEFIISTNLGEPLKSLSKIASGGEMSRIMLAFKTILADVDNISTLIFDEIDTGISGRTAQIIAERLHNLSEHHQIICITHLPQIAAMADHHYLIEKIEKENKINTIVKKLNDLEQVHELGRLLDGKLTDITLQHAEEMIRQAHLRKGK
ncbi:DNA repair protein RecN [Alkaliphilus oremlandii]|uniref:DNA repair protein RecN n=1 Tax=Alkaliphilus oremlandii (strain OhILAs) TaxID=350688 RepID=A8MFI4_ALKOO|nr:DNA repair protein RecN [Alkaliphilus oremlandii]ABW19147.1 DNA repair protein RecN [Alkaliphilus oremlandii OhILAs]